VPPELERIIRKCLRKRREERYQSTRELLVDLRNLRGESSEMSAPVSIDADTPDSQENLFRSALIHLIPTPRRWWEVLTFFAFICQAPAIYGAWRVRQVSMERWASIVFLMYLANGIGHLTLRAIVILSAAIVPRELPHRVRSFALALRLIYYLQSFLIGLMAVGLGFERYPLAAPLLIGVAVFVFVWAAVYEPMVERLAFPSSVIIKSREAQSQRRSTAWRWQHQLGSTLATTPLVVLLTWKARAFIPPEMRDPVFFFNVLALGLHWAARFALVSQAFGNPANLPAQARSMRRAILWTGWPVVAGLLASAFAVANSNVVLAAVLAALAMGGVGCLVFLDPAVERAAFGISTADE
jgi:hypothetical protein